MLKLFPLRRSFSLDLAPDDSNSNFLLHASDDHSDLHVGAHSNHLGAHLFSSHGPGASKPSHATSTVLYPNMTTAVHWPVDDIDDALAADFDGSLSGLGIELGTSNFNMSDALMALPSLSSLKHQSGEQGSNHGLHGHHHPLPLPPPPSHHHPPPHHPLSAGHLLNPSMLLSASSLQANIRGQHSTDLPTSLERTADSPQLNGTSSGAIDEKPVAVVHGKKNRLAYGTDDDHANHASAIKRFCLQPGGPERAAGAGSGSAGDLPSSSSASTVHPTILLGSTGSSVSSSHQHEQEGTDEGNGQGHHCTDDCYTEGHGCSLRHSSSVPDLRSHVFTSVAAAAVASASNPPVVTSHGSSASSPSSSSTSAATPSTTSFFSQIISNQINNLSSVNAVGSPSLSHELPHIASSRHTSKFQYVLGASTSMAIKMHEETMTYLNQGQSYEIKLKKVGDLSEVKGKMLKTILRVCFHDRRLQYMERELIDQWKEQRPSERVLEIDTPLSFGVYDVRNDPRQINKSEFFWDPTKETGVFIKINCISTEFTPKKHGGEKGVPFRIVIETYCKESTEVNSCLHTASCQVKVFKPKGADRKHKTDREKMNKKPPQEQEKFQPSYDCTVFTDCTMDTFNVYSVTGAGLVSTPTPSVDSEVADQLPLMSSKNLNLTVASKSGPFGKTGGGSGGGGLLAANALVSNVSSPLSDKNSNSKPCAFNIFADINENSFDLNFTNFTQMHSLAHTLSTTTHLTSASPAEVTVKWLKENRFDAHLDTFSQFSGKDILVLSKDELIRICGLTDGIRLYNGLHARNVKPKLTIYLSLPDDEVFRAFYLDTLTVAELQAKILSTLLLSKCNYLKRLCVMGPAGVKVLVSDDVVKNLTEESLYIVELTKDFNGEFSAILKPYTAK